MEVKNYPKFTYLYGIIACLILYYIDQILQTNYLSKSLTKILLFLIIPLTIIIKQKKNIIRQNINKLKQNKINKKAIALSILSAAIIILTYILIRNHLNIENITKDFFEKYQFTKNTIIIGAIYLIFINSLIEEIFFRGFIYQTNMNKKSNVFSALLFALYHLANFNMWANIPIILSLLIGLFLSGLVLNYFTKKDSHIFSAWIIHLIADLAIVIAGFHLLGIY
ncbi:MAG: CPBP family intramembrane glutamic endopeptidase [Candidatus Woesearchaeota archaeon]